MNSAAIRRITSVLLTAALAAGFVVLAGALTQEDAHAAVPKAAVKKAKTYKKKANKLFKVGKAWYCFSRKKVKKGLQKVGGKYYFFNKSTGKMLVKSKLMKIGTSYYYFQKKSGKAPSAGGVKTNADGKIVFIKPSGSRYNYPYTDTGNVLGNIAAGIIISEANIQPSGTGSSEELEAAYKKIVLRSGYDVLASMPDLSTETWPGSYAIYLAATKGGKCYNFAALTYYTFKALGSPTAQLCIGKCQTRPGQTDPATGSEYAPTAHAWVEVLEAEGFGVLYAYDSVFDVTKSGKDMSFCRKRVTAEGDFQEIHTIDRIDYIYYIEMML